MGMEMKVLVLGSEGFIGKKVSYDLVSKGFVVDCFDRNIDRYQDTRNPYALPNENFDAVVHLIGSSDRVWGQENPGKMLRENCSATMVVLDAYPKAHHLFMSSCLVYGNPLTLPVDVDDPCNPVCAYGMSKLVSELCVKGSVDNYTIFRGFNIFGSEMQGLRFLREVSLAKKNNTEVTLYRSPSGEDIYRDYIHIDDVYPIFSKAIAQGIFGTYNLGTGQPTFLIDICQKAEVPYKAQTLPPWEIVGTYASINETIKDFDWAPDKDRIWEYVDGIR